MAEIMLPDWMRCMDKDRNGGKLTAIERFVLDNEPAGTEDETKFREQLQAALDEAWWIGKED